MTEQAVTLETPQGVMGAAERGRRVWVMTLGIAVLLLASFAVQVSTYRVADWSRFAFYDPGTALKGDWFLSRGYVPTVDFGYTHGLLSLAYGRVGFAVLGRTPWAFMVLTLLTEMAMAWALARIFVALKIGKPALAVFIAALPMAILPMYLTLTHTLEVMLILLALAEQAEGKRRRALALMTACLFVKPSMAYLYGFVLVVLMLWGSRKPEARSQKFRWWELLREFLPAGVTGVVIGGGLAAWVGMGAVLRTVVPATETYAASGFGFFGVEARTFWMPGQWSRYFCTPTGMFLLAAAASAVGAGWAIGKLAARREGTEGFNPSSFLGRRLVEILLTVGVLHTTFLLGFYGWSGSWTYYSYLAMLGLVLAMELLRMRWVAAAALLGLLILSHAELAGTVWLDWKWKTREADGLWAYPATMDEWREVEREANDGPVVVMANGWLGKGTDGMPGNFEMADAWFPEPGIPTAVEVERVKKQVAGAKWVVVWRQYGKFDLWNSVDFAEERGEFEEVWKKTQFELLRRK